MAHLIFLHSLDNSAPGRKHIAQEVQKEGYRSARYLVVDVEFSEAKFNALMEHIIDDVVDSNIRKNVIYLRNDDWLSRVSDVLSEKYDCRFTRVQRPSEKQRDEARSIHRDAVISNTLRVDINISQGGENVNKVDLFNLFWTQTIDEYRVLLFSHIFPRQQSFIESRCSTSGGRRIQQVRDTLMSSFSLLKGDIGNPLYELVDDVKHLAESKVENDYGVGGEVVGQQLQQIFEAVDILSPSFVTSITNFFTSLDGVTLVHEGQDARRGSKVSVFECSGDESWRAVLVFLPSQDPSTDTTWVFDHLIRYAALNDTIGEPSTNLRFIASPFISDATLEIFEGVRDRREVSFAFDAVDALYMQKITREGRTSNEKSSLFPRIFLDQNIGGLSTFRRKWQELM